MKELEFNISGLVTVKNYKFILAMACMLGGKLFTRVPNFVRVLKTKDLAAPVE